MSRPLATCLLLVFPTLGLSAPILDISHVSETRLPNGLHVIVKHEPYWDVAAGAVHIRCGSINDPPDKIGVAHLLEHLLFKARGKNDGGLGLAIESLGGYVNAETLQDFTWVQFLVASSQFEKALELVADRIKQPAIDKDTVRREKRVVMREIADRQAEAATAIHDMLWMTALERHPYRWPVGGTTETVAKISVEDLLAAHRNFYVPNNMALTVVGDVEPAAVFAAAEKLFGQMPRRPIQWQPPPDEPFPRQIRTKVVQRPGGATLVAVGFQAPGMDSKRQVCAMDLIYTHLGEGDQSWLSSYLVREKQLALGATCDFLTHRHPGMLIITAVCKPDKEIDLRQAIIDKINRLRSSALSDRELARAKSLLYTAYAFSNETYVDQVGSIGFYEMIDTYKFAFDYIDIVQSITAEELREVALRYLDPDRRAVAIMRPRSRGQEEALAPWPLG